MMQNARVTAFTVSELLRENQQGGKITNPSQGLGWDNPQSLEYITLLLQWEQNSYQVKVITTMKNYNQSIEINHNPNWPYTFDYPDRILIIGGPGPGKNNVLPNLIKHQRPDTVKIYLCERSIRINLSIAY